MSDSVTVESDLDIRATYLSAEELKLAASLLFQAYLDDPVFLDIFKHNKEGYEQRLRASIREELTVFWEAEQPIIGLYLGESLIGVACLNSPDEQGIASKRFWHWHLKMLLGAGYSGTKQLLENEQKITAAVPLTSFYLLSFFAIHPLHQHRGYGQYLISAVNSILEEHTDTEGVAVYATSEKLNSFFAKAQYQYVEEVTVNHVTGALMVYHRGS